MGEPEAVQGGREPLTSLLQALSERQDTASWESSKTEKSTRPPCMHACMQVACMTNVPYLVHSCCTRVQACERENLELKSRLGSEMAAVSAAGCSRHLLCVPAHARLRQLSQ